MANLFHNKKPKNITWIDGSLVNSHKTWFVKVHRASDPTKVYALLSVGKTRLSLHDCQTQEVQYEFPYLDVEGFETNAAYELFIWNFKPDVKANGELWSAKGRGAQICIDIQNEINYRIVKGLEKKWS